MNVENLTEVRYQFFTIKFTPLNGVNKTSKDIVYGVMNYIFNKKLNENKGHLIDRHEGRNNSRRELFMNSSYIIARDQRIRCSLALLRNGKVPLIKPKEEYKLIPITDSILGSIAEETHFFIDYSKNQVIICCEYNHYGPRITDIEYYFRNVAHKVLRESKKTEVTAFIDAPIDETLSKLKNVLNINMKIDPKEIDRMAPDVYNKYFSGMKNLSKIFDPKFLRVEAYFQSPGGAIKSDALNSNANNMMRDLLRKLKGNQIDFDAFQSFQFKYEDKDGNEELFNLLTGKKEIILEVDMNIINSSRKWYDLIKPELDNFIASL
ncbi:hypothetical protein [Chryseobacterium camelliae]|uniref:hypothetical protein n=1 Tax=Chryseobacterium camelliae TaxID=1265445 RepID=UPI002855001F|nr:hypothetical protein [Chryseobacterium camelliae]MDR6516662.1 hypothetical protein [Chryseobacterium camelliae]